MRTVTFKSVLHGVATRTGLDPVNNLETNQAKALAEYIDTELEIAWQMAPWPEWTNSELRRFRADWLSTSAYVQGDEVFNPFDGAYYRCILANSNQVPTDTLYWESLTDFDRFIARSQPWESSTIGEVWGVFADDPKRQNRPRRVGYWESPNGIQIAPEYTSNPNQVYIEFSSPPPHFCADDWDSEISYSTGDCVYYFSTGECYQALANSTNILPVTQAFWQKQDFPFVLAKYCKFKAKAEALREDENEDKARLYDQKANKELLDALDRIEKLRREREGFISLAH